MMKKRVYRLALVVIAAVLLAGCGGAAGHTNSGDNDNVLVYGSGDYTRINPAIDEHGEINILLFDGLTRHGKDNLIEPGLAKSWEYDEGSYTYTFHLDKGVKWHDGEYVSAEDVKFTFDAIMNPDNESENAPNYEDVESIDIIDEDTISFTLSAPNRAFLDYMTIAILPKHLLEGEDMQSSDYFRHPVGTGPYKLENWDVGQAIILARNDDYFRGKANIEKIIFKIVPDDTAKALQLKSGELDLAQVTPKDAQTFDGEDGIVQYDMITSDYRGILYNFYNEYWQKNADLIPAINYAIDRQAILDAVLLGKGEVAYSPLQRNPYNDPDMEKFEYNPKKCEEMLKALGCEKQEDGYYYRDGEQIGFVLNATSGDQVRIDMALIAAMQLNQVGIKVEAQVPESIDWGGQQCCIIGWGSPFDADDHTYKVFGTDKGANYSGYSNDKVDYYLTMARETDDIDARREAYKGFLKAICDYPPYTFFCYIDAIYMAKDKILGIDKDAVLGHHGVGIFYNICEWNING